MNENAKALVRALRSGKYRQHHGALRKGNRFCCLGVACDLAIKAGVKDKGGKRLRWIKVPYGNAYGIRVDSGNPVYPAMASLQTAVLPEAVRKWLGFRDIGGEFSGGRGSLASMNDTAAEVDEDGLFLKHKYDFKAIAAKIESEPAGLFEKPRAKK